jgi:hypothetical protein
MLSRVNKLPLVSKSEALCLVSVPRLLFGWKIITSNIEIEYSDYRKNHIRLHLKQQKTLRDSENPKF